MSLTLIHVFCRSVMATDIMDKDLKKLRNDRWDKAFGLADDEGMVPCTDPREDSNRKATIVIEHMIQAVRKRKIAGARYRGSRSHHLSDMTVFFSSSSQE